DGDMVEIEQVPALDKKYKHDIEVVVDRLAVREGIETRLADSFETALKLAEGLAYVDLADTTVAEALSQLPFVSSEVETPARGLSTSLEANGEGVKSSGMKGA